MANAKTHTTSGHECTDLENRAASGSLPLNFAREPKMSMREAAKAMGGSTTKLRRLVADGEIPVIQYDGRYVFLERDINDFLAGRYGTVHRVAAKRRRIKKRYLNSDVLKVE